MRQTFDADALSQKVLRPNDGFTGRGRSTIDLASDESAAPSGSLSENTGTMTSLRFAPVRK
jgi:hypothetical protein